jgi:hypothetical protein
MSILFSRFAPGIASLRMMQGSCWIGRRSGEPTCSVDRHGPKSPTMKCEAISLLRHTIATSFFGGVKYLADSSVRSISRS